MKTQIISLLFLLAANVQAQHSIKFREAPTPVHKKIALQNWRVKVDSLLNEMQSGLSTGGVFLISIKGEPVYERAYGQSNLELQTPMVVDNVFEIGSMTKQFTAISVMMLAEQGKLSVNDKINSYLPEYPNGDMITIHHLLTHTSGIRDFTRVKGLNGIAKSDLTPKELIDFFKDEQVDFQPGENFKYCNAGYILLGYIIEKASGISYAQFVKKEIFDRLNMTHSFYASHREVIPNRAYGYTQRNDQYLNNRYISFSIPYSSGSLMSTVHDLVIWQEALKNNILINEVSTDHVFRDHYLNDGEPIHYGYGWHIREVNDKLSYQHGGSIFGFKSMGVYLPKEDVYVIGLTNCECNSPTKVTQEIASIVADNLR